MSPMSIMSSRSLSRFLLSFMVCVGLTTAFPAAAGMTETMNISETIDESFTEQAQKDEALFQKLGEKQESFGNKMIDTLINLQKEQVREEITPAIDYDLYETLNGVPSATAMTSMLVTTVLDSRYRELNLITLNRAGSALARGQIDSTKGALSNDPQNFRVFMDYFCDPYAQGGDFGKIGNTKAIGQNNDYDIQDRETKYKYVCGVERIKQLKLPAGDVFSAGAETLNNLQIMGLPLKPQLLLFEPMTFPAIPAKNIATNDQTNVNPMADLVFGAYKYFERLVLGNPPDRTQLGADLETASGREAYFQKQATIARQMLASYPFAMLYAERMGAMNKEAAKAAASMLRSHWEGATIDKEVLAVIETLEKQQTMSVAQYMDIIMYKALMSPGYMTRISSLSPSQLQREKIYLLGMQNVLKYQVNRWMEISTALAAVKQ